MRPRPVLRDAMQFLVETPRLSTHPLTDLFSLLGNFLFCIRDFHVRCSHTQTYSWERTGSVCIIHLCSVFAQPPTLFLSHLILAYS
jgi:hypothetical protein